MKGILAAAHGSRLRYGGGGKTLKLERIIERENYISRSGYPSRITRKHRLQGDTPMFQNDKLKVGKQFRKNSFKFCIRIHVYGQETFMVWDYV